MCEANAECSNDCESKAEIVTSIGSESFDVSVPCLGSESRRRECAKQDVRVYDDECTMPWERAICLDSNKYGERAICLDSNKYGERVTVMDSNKYPDLKLS